MLIIINRIENIKKIFKSNNTLYLSVLLLLFIGSIFLSKPFGDFPIDDDWSF